MRLRTARTALAVVAALLILGACGGNSSNSATSKSDTSKSATVQPGDASKVDRTIEIKTTEALKFDPDSLNVKSGETVMFQIVNLTQIDHEFVVGDAAFQDEHEKEMAAMPAGMAMGDEPTSIKVPAGQTKTIDLTFPTPGTLIYGCHEAGHYPAGMKGEIKVT